MWSSLVLKIYSSIYILILNCTKKNVRLGKNFKIDFKTKLDVRNNKLNIGNNVYLRSKSAGYHAGMPFPTNILIDKSGAECTIGDNCRINGVYIHSQKNIVIGNNTVIASGVNIIDVNGHETYSLNRTVGRDTAKEIIIGNNVWIGLNAIILKGTYIGDNSIVSAGSVVQGSFPNNSLIQGNPAKLVKELNILV